MTLGTKAAHQKLGLTEQESVIADTDSSLRNITIGSKKKRNIAMLG